MNVRTRNLIIDILGILIVLGGFYKEFLTDAPMPVWEWVVVSAVGFLAIALHTKDIKDAWVKYRNKKLK